jgi:hypothetical protein
VDIEGKPLGINDDYKKLWRWKYDV